MDMSKDQKEKDKLNAEIERHMNDPKMHGHLVGTIAEMKKDGLNDMQILAMGILITRLAKKVVIDNGEKAKKENEKKGKK